MLMKLPFLKKPVVVVFKAESNFIWYMVLCFPKTFWGRSVWACGDVFYNVLAELSGVLDGKKSLPYNEVWLNS
jgi:hypothetical protein